MPTLIAMSNPLRGKNNRIAGKHRSKCLVRLNHCARYAPGGGIEPHRFTQDHFGIFQIGIILRSWCTVAENLIEFTLEALRDLRMLREEIESPGKSVRRGLVPGQDQGYTFIADLIIVHALAASFVVFGSEQHRQKISVSPQ